MPNSFRIDFLRRMGLAFSSPIWHILGDKKALTLDLAELSQDSSSLGKVRRFAESGVLGDVESMFAKFHESLNLQIDGLRIGDRDDYK